MSRYRNSIELAKSSWNVLKADRELIWLPVISVICTIIVGALFALPSALAVNSGGAFKISGFVGLFFTFVLLAYTTIFFNAALVHAADERMRGGDPDLKSAIAGAQQRWRQILPWAIVSASVSVVLRTLEERAGFLGRIVIGFVGMAWSLVTFLVLPILVLEGVGVRAAVTRSTELFKRTWGEQVIANAGMSLLGLLAVLPGIAVGFVGFASGSALIAVPLVTLAGIYIAGVLAITAALSGVFQTALYHYAANGMPPAAFANVDLGGAFVARRRR